MEVSDAVLLQRAVRGDQAAFDRLVRRHTPRMYRVAVRITGAAAEAEDAVQDAWISAWRALPEFREEAAVSTWLYRVVTNAARMQVRRRKPVFSLDAVLEPAYAEHLLTDAAADPARQVVSADELERVFRAIAGLELSQRVPLVLHELEGLSYHEVADILGVEVTALRSRLHRARVALLAKLKERR